MKWFNVQALVIGFAIVAAIGIAGCSQRADEQGNSQANQPSAGEHGHDGEPIHGGWWCYEHGIPEEKCAMCNTKLAAEMREQGDWCAEHNRPESLCFTCDPSRADKFVALYEAKYGERPPQATD